MDLFVSSWSRCGCSEQLQFSLSLSSAVCSVEDASWDVRRFVCRRGICVDEASVCQVHLFAKFSEAVNKCFGAYLRKVQSRLYELADPELIVVYAESQARGVSVTTVLKR